MAPTPTPDPAYVIDAESAAVALHELRRTLTMSNVTAALLGDCERLLTDYIRVLRSPASLRQAVPEIPWADLRR